MSSRPQPWWSDQSVVMWGVRAVGLAAVLGGVTTGQPSPGLTGRHLVLLIGLVVAAAAWLAWLPPGRVDERVIVAVLATGMVGGGLASVISPNTSALALPAVLAMLAGGALPSLQAAGVTACGVVTLVAGGLSINSSGSSLFGASVAVVGGLIVGLWRRQYRLRAEQAEQLAVQTKRAEGERVRAQVLDERARIAREIHDILAHTLGGLVIQLDAADAVLGDGSDIDKGRNLVGGARRLAVEGLRETRQCVAALRADPVAVPEALAALAEGDSHVRHQVTGSPRQLSPDVGLAVYRTAQEALTNARKHAAPDAPVDIFLSFEEQAVALRVTNPLPAQPAAGDALSPATTGGDASSLAGTGGGYGLLGLRERAELLGGTLQAGPSGGSWLVELRVPA